ncbi:PAH-inducible cytochrome P450 monooxygenase PC-PAH 1 [Gautieria morchelliformis]|nr:PAH-inducible cytochrome P450 monooxygenase PC-PAH 1 [Gautieria morchelliformis]
MILSIGLPLLLLSFLLRAIIRRSLSRSISNLPGPAPGPWLVGNLPELLRPDNVAEAEFGWTKKYGTAMKIKGAFGVDVLFTADPKAMQYILNIAGYNFPGNPQSIAGLKLIVGPGILFAQGAEHARHRKIMNPAFSYSSLRLFLPIFHNISEKTVAKWKDAVAQNGGLSAVIDIPSWLARTTLDAIGRAAFDHDFGAIDAKEDELSVVYKNLFADSFFKRSDFAIAFENLWGYLPLWVVSAMRLLPIKQLRRLRRYTKVAHRVANDIVQTQTESYSRGKECGKDIMSILIRANLSEDPKSKLSETEVMAQLKTLMIAGQETTASTLSWAFYELSRNPGFQSRVREEIKTTRAQAAQRGNGELTIADLDSMQCLLSVMKETLRYHPILTILSRVAGREDIIPLSSPQTTKTGEVVTSFPVSKGQRVLISIAAYNRLSSVWGDDADVWRPERFLEGVHAKQQTGLGVIANLATFGSGIRNCIGWRFALLEMQTILIDILENFEFSPPPGNPEIIRSATAVMSPMVKGKPGCAQLPLTITALR